MDTKTRVKVLKGYLILQNLMHPAKYMIVISYLCRYCGNTFFVKNAQFFFSHITKAKQVQSTRARVYVDTGPILERELARKAGIEKEKGKKEEIKRKEKRNKKKKTKVKTTKEKKR
jgi:hypothetical protein